MFVKGNERKKKCTSIDDGRIHEVWKANNLGRNGRLLVAFLFATKEEMRHTRMHPEFCAADTTFGTENTKKELFTLTFKNGNNQLLNGGRAYIPNAQKWVFEMMFKELLPTFWGPEICERLRLVITDGCCNEYVSFMQNIGINKDGGNKSFPNAVIGLCYYHLVIQGFKRSVTPSLPKEGSEYELNKLLIPKIKEYIKSWYFDVETEEEFLYSKSHFWPWLDNLVKLHGFNPAAAATIRYVTLCHT